MNNPLYNPSTQLKTNRFFSDFTELEIAELLEQSYKVTFKKDATIFEQGQPGDVMYFIEKGQVRLGRIDPTGKELTLAILGPQEFFGEMAVLDDFGRSANAYAISSLTLLAINRGTFTQLLLKHPRLALKIITTLCLRLRMIDQRIEELAFGSVKDRLRNLLLHNHSEKTIFLKQTHQELAAKVCTSRETVTRVLKALKNEGYIIKKVPKGQNFND